MSKAAKSCKYPKPAKPGPSEMPPTPAIPIRQRHQMGGERGGKR